MEGQTKAEPALEVIMQRTRHNDPPAKQTASLLVDSDAIFDAMHRSTYKLNTNLAGLPNIKFSSDLDYLISLLKHEYAICNDDVIFKQIVISHKSRVEKESKTAVNELLRQKCNLANHPPEKLRSQMLQEIRDCIEQSCDRYKKYRHEQNIESSVRERSASFEIRNTLLQLLQALDEKRSTLQSLAYAEILKFCWKYIDDCVSGIYEQADTVVIFMDEILNVLSCRKRNAEVQVTDSSFRNTHLNLFHYRQKFTRMCGGQTSDSVTVIINTTSSRELLRITSSLQSVAENLLEGVNRKIQERLSTQTQKNHFVVELRKASINSDLLRAEKAAREFTKTATRDVEEINRKEVVLSRLKSIDQLNRLIYEMENEIENLRLKHSNAVEELMNKRRNLKALLGELGKMRSKIEKLLQEMKISQTEYENDRRRISEERHNIISSSNLDKTMRDMLLHELKTKIMELETKHKQEIEQFESQLSGLREETLMRHSDIENELRNQVTELEEQLFTATDSEKAIILEKIALIHTQLMDLSPIFEEGESDSLEENSLFQSEAAVDKYQSVNEQTEQSSSSNDMSDSSKASTSSSSDWSSTQDEEVYQLCQEIGYLKFNVTRELIDALVDCIIKKPADPASYISGFIEHRRQVKAKQELRYKKDQALQEERARIQAMRMTEFIPRSSRLFGEDG